jgi:hypothetical protein
LIDFFQTGASKSGLSHRDADRARYFRESLCARPVRMAIMTPRVAPH